MKLIASTLPAMTESCRPSIGSSEREEIAQLRFKENSIRRVRLAQRPAAVSRRRSRPKTFRAKASKLLTDTKMLSTLPCSAPSTLFTAKRSQSLSISKALAVKLRTLQLREAFTLLDNGVFPLLTSSTLKGWRCVRMNNSRARR